MRYIGLDLGTRTVGVAYSDLTGTIALPDQTYRFNDLIDDGIMFVEEHQYLIDEYGEDGLEVMLDEYWKATYG